VIAASGGEAQEQFMNVFPFEEAKDEYRPLV
jgi:hypothetical protein